MTLAASAEGDTALRAADSSELAEVLATLAACDASSPLAVASVKAPLVEPSSLAVAGSSTYLWAPEGEAWVGIDEARQYRATGLHRFSEIERQVMADLSVSDPALRVFGGFAFWAGQESELWREFGDAFFVLPRFVYRRSKTEASFSVTLTRGELANLEERRRFAKKLVTWVHRLAELPVGPVAASTDARKPLTVQGVDAERWAGMVRDIAERIEQGEATKVVAARKVQYDFPSEICLRSTLQALGQNAGGATCFALRLGDVAFVGASPERLIKKAGLDVETEALAGTFRTSGSHFSEELLRSPKEHSEHAPVLDAIVERLGPVCEPLQYPSSPEMRELPNLLHLRTPIRGRLKRDAHVLQLVERLHPTPAVGGVPTEVAVSWIVEHEADPRGFYAAPVGWFDGRGDGEFCVALRSGLLSGRRATLFAGGGIVRGSDPADEYAETELKLRALYSSLRFL